MKRIINGNYANADSTRTISEISSEQFELIKESIAHLKGKYAILLNLSNDQWDKMMQEWRRNEGNLSLEEFSASGEQNKQEREELCREADIVTVLEARILLLVLSDEKKEISELSVDEFRVLIDALRNYCLDLTNLINSTPEELRNQVKNINSGDKLISEENFKKGLDKISSEEYKDKLHGKVKILYQILESINQPYEGLKYLDSNGNKVVPKIKKINPTSIN